MCDIMTSQIVDGVHGVIFQKANPNTLMRAFSLLVSKGKLSKFAHLVASSGTLLAKNMLASESVYDYSRLLENVLHFPSDSFLPRPSQIQHQTWEWILFRKEIEERDTDTVDSDQNRNFLREPSVVDSLEDEFANVDNTMDMFKNDTENLTHNIPTILDWDILREMESSEDYERQEIEEVLFYWFIDFFFLF